MGVLLNRRRYMSASKQAKTLFEMYNQYFDGTVNSVVDTGLKLWDGTHNRWKMEAVYQKLSGQTILTTFFTVRPDVSPYSGIRLRSVNIDFDLTLSDSWNIIKNDGGFGTYVHATYGNALQKDAPLDYDSLTIIRDGNILFIDYNGYTATIQITDPRTNNMNLLIGCDYKGANNETQRYYTGTVQKFVIKELPPADEVIMTSITNPEVLAVCYAQGWCADENYMTKSEAEAVTNIGTAFYNNTSITHFEEFEYFTSVTSLANNAFRGCSNLTSITLPYTVTTLGDRTFQGDTKLSSINLSNVETIGILCFYSCTSLVDIDISGCKNLAQGAFANCSNLETLTSVSNIVTIGSGNEGAFQYTKISGSLVFTSFTGSTIPVSLLLGTPVADVQFPSSNYTSIGTSAFRNTRITSFVVKDGCTTLNNHSLSGSYFKLIDLPSTLTSWTGWVMYQNGSQEVIISRASTPPTVDNNAFYQVPSSCKVYVPSASISVYEAATGWSKFAGRYIALEGSIYE